MKKFNINNYIYIQITDEGWEHLEKTVGKDYIKHCIKNEHYESVIDGKTWYRLQMHSVFELLPVRSRVLFETNIMFDNESLPDYENI